MDKTKTAPTQVPKKRGPAVVLRPAIHTELDLVHKLVHEAIDTSPFYNSLFKQAEKQRMNRQHLERLHAVNPAHVMICMCADDISGCMVSSPDFGTLWLHWSYLMPEFRRGATALTALRSFVEYFDNGDFHKIATYTKHGNDAAAAIMKRYGYNHICTLEKQFFGEDYLLYERPLTKTSETYDNGVVIEGRIGRINRRLTRLVRLAKLGSMLEGVFPGRRTVNGQQSTRPHPQPAEQ